MQEMRPGKRGGEAAPIQVFWRSGMLKRCVRAHPSGSALLRLVKDNGFVAVNEHSIFEMPADRLG